MGVAGEQVCSLRSNASPTLPHLLNRRCGFDECHLIQATVAGVMADPGEVKTIDGTHR